jgi:hypothetical protein
MNVPVLRTDSIHSVDCESAVLCPTTFLDTVMVIISSTAGRIAKETVATKNDGFYSKSTVSSTTFTTINIVVRASLHSRRLSRLVSSRFDCLLVILRIDYARAKK